MIIENVSNLDESIKMFMYVHHNESWINEYKESISVNIKRAILQQVKFHNIISHERIFSCCVVACAFLFIFFKKIITYMIFMIMVSPNKNKNDIAAKVSNTVQIIKIARMKSRDKRIPGITPARNNRPMDCSVKIA